MIDARRGEVFTALFERGTDGVPCELVAPRAESPEDLASLPAGTVAVGDGVLRHPDAFALADVELPPAASALHLVRAAAVCRLVEAGAGGGAAPTYLRRPDAEVRAAAP